jgi:two-component system phosphate regulon sensor histidine kinase PhoR
MAWFGRDPRSEIKTVVENLRVQLKDLAQENLRLAAVLSNMTEGVVAVDAQSRVLIMNPALGAIFGAEPAQARGRPFLEAVRHNQLNDLVHHVLKQAKPKSSEVHVFSSQESVFEAHAVPLLNAGHASGALLVLRDVTQLRHLEKVRRDFIANVSHDLRTPLASIKGFAETLRDGALADPTHALEFVQSIEKHADNMIALVQDLLELTSIESGQRRPSIRPVKVAEVLTEAIRDLAPLARKKNVEIKNDVDSAAGTALVDEKQLKQILINLTENAIKFNEKNGWVRFTAERADGHLRLIVADNGAGIPAQDLARIFERFYRTDRARSRDHGGTGLGLSIVKHLVEANHGTVTVESSVGKGSQFTVSFPLA